MMDDAHGKLPGYVEIDRNARVSLGSISWRLSIGPFLLTEILPSLSPSAPS